MLRKCNSTYRVQVFGGAPAAYMRQRTELGTSTQVPHPHVGPLMPHKATATEDEMGAEERAAAWSRWKIDDAGD